MITWIAGSAWRQLDDDPIALAADLRRMLGGI
jgi:hypothetical protein